MRDANPFEILGLTPDATYDATWDAYKEQVRRCQASAQSGGTASAQDRRMSDLNWAIDELEERREIWVQRSRRAPEVVGATDYGMDRRGHGLPLLASVFVLMLVIGIGLIAWTMLNKDESSATPGTSLRSNSQLPPGPRTVPQVAANITSAPAQSAPAPVVAPIDVEQVKADIRRRRETPGAGPLQFEALKTAFLTGGSQPDVVIQWPSGGTCGNFTEVWGYYKGKAAKLLPAASDTDPSGGCGGIDLQDYLNLGHEQIASLARTYDAAQFSGGEYLMRTVSCWTGDEFLPIVSYFENVDRKRLRTEQRNPQSRCK